MQKTCDTIAKPYFDREGGRASCAGNLPGTASFRIAGMHKMTAVDFPGVVSAIIFTQGCNFVCPYCHNPQLIAQECSLPPDAPEGSDVLAFLKKRAGLIDGLVISGGEPTLQAGLAGFCREVKALGLKVKLDTNGSRPEAVEALLAEHLLDYVAMDLKAAPTRYAAFCLEEDIAAAVVKSASLLRASGVPHEFRTTCVAPFVNYESKAGSGAGVGAESGAASGAASGTASDVESDVESGAELRELLALAGASPWYAQRANLTEGMVRKGLGALSAQDISGLVDAAIGMGVKALPRGL